jgi:hypothetical protein
MKLSLLFAGLLAAVSMPTSAATLLINSSGLLTGATGINIEGGIFDVEFLDGTCSALFAGCDDQSDFPFEYRHWAWAAEQALLDQVFLDGLDGAFDAVPALTRGCEGATSLCQVVTPYDRLSSNYTVVNVAVAQNAKLGLGNDVGLSDVFAVEDTSTVPTMTWARFTQIAAIPPLPPVPEPATWAMMIGGFALAGRALRRAPGQHRSRSSPCRPIPISSLTRIGMSRS